MNTPQTPEAGDTLTPGEQMPSQTLASASRASAVTADVTRGPEGRVYSDRRAEEPPARAAADVSQRQPFPSFMRRYIDMAGESGPKMDQPRPLAEVHFVPRTLREARAVTRPVTPSQAPVAASVTPAVTVAPVAGSICPTCQCRVPARLTPAERQRAYRRRQREQGQGVAKGD